MSSSESTPPKRVTQGDIARELGISRIAVSYALRQSKNVSKETHKRVLDAANRMGYRVNAGARAMRIGTSLNIGLIKSEGRVTSVLPQALLSALLREVNRRNRHLIITQVGDDQLTDSARLPVSIREHIVDGAFVYYTHSAPHLVSTVLKRAGLPVVWLNVRRPTGCVYYDEIAAGRQVAERLIDAGCRSFVCLSQTKASESADKIHYSRPDREQGFTEAVAQAGFKMIRLPEPARGEPCALPATLASRKRKIGIFGYSSHVVTSAGLALLERGLTPGKDAQLATVAGAPQFFGPYPLETVYLDYDGLAAAGFTLLEKQMADPGKSLRSVSVPPLPVGRFPGQPLR